jgi:hypothetical protein
MKKIIFVLIGLILSLNFLSSTNVTAASSANYAVSQAADCSTAGPTDNGSYLKCSTQIFGIRCIFPVNCAADNSTNDNWRFSLVGLIIDFLIGLSPIMAVLVMVYAGYLFYYSSLTGADDKSARKTIQSAVIGLVIILLVNTYRTYFINFGDGTYSARVANRGDNNPSFLYVVVDIANKILTPLIDIIRYAAITYSVISILYAGYLYYAASTGGDAKKSIDALRNAVVGVLIAILSTSIVGLLQNIIASF